MLPGFINPNNRDLSSLSSMKPSNNKIYLQVGLVDPLFPDPVIDPEAYWHQRCQEECSNCASNERFGCHVDLDWDMKSCPSIDEPGYYQCIDRATSAHLRCLESISRTCSGRTRCTCI